MNLQSKLRDIGKQEQGVWVTYDEEGDYAVFLIAAQDSERFKSELGRRAKPLAKIKDPSPSLVSKITNEALAEALLLDWKNVLDGAGQPIPATYENKLLLFQRAPELKEWICQQASLAENYRSEAEAAELAACKSDAPMGA